MKRLIFADTQIYTIDEIKSAIESEIHSRDLDSAINSFNVYDKSTRSCEVIIYLSSKHHGKKIRELIPFQDAQSGIQHLMYQIQNYVTTGYTALDADAYVFQVTWNNQVLGYLCRPEKSRGWSTTELLADPHARRVRRFEFMPDYRVKQILDGYYPTYLIGDGFGLPLHAQGVSVKFINVINAVVADPDIDAINNRFPGLC